VSLEFEQVITVQDTSVPVVDQDPGDLDRTIECSDPAALADALALVPTFTDNCDATPGVQLVSSVSTQVMDGSCAQYSYTITRRWTATDACGNVSLEFEQVITVQDR
jgi:large repetitive protein